MPASITITAKPTFRDLQGRFARATEELMKERREGMRRLGRRWVEIVDQEAPKRTGDFAKKHTYRTFDQGNAIELRMYIPQPLGDWMQYGTGIYGPLHRRIYPRRAKALKFLWEGGPRSSSVFTAYHFYRSVAGMKPNKYRDRVYQQWKPETDTELRRISSRYIEVISQ